MLGHLVTAIIVTILLLGGPLTIFIIIKILNSLFGDIKAKFVKNQASEDAPLALYVQWDNRSFEYAVNRVRVEFNEMVPGGRSTAFSVTFEDKKAQKKSFLLPLKLSENDLKMLTDQGIPSHPESLKRSFVTLEVERVNGDVVRKKIPKSEIIASLKGAPLPADPDVTVLAATQPDSWSVFTRVFPWRKVEEVAAAEENKPKAKKEKTSSAPANFDFIITKVWIEPGCIVCDACENEAPDVFQVLADTCVVRENAPLGNTGSIVAAADGCPVNVIKYETAPKAS